MTINNLSWVNTACKIIKSEDTTKIYRKLNEFKEESGLDIRIEYEDGYYWIYNDPKLLFKEEEYLKLNKYFSYVYRKLSIKDYNSDLYYFKNNNTIEKISNADFPIYQNVIEDNNIDGIAKKDLMVSVQVIDKLEKSEAINRIKNIYILLFLSNKTIYNNNNFEFIFFDENSFYKYNIKFDDIDVELTNIYNWIIDNPEYRDAYKVKLSIVRQIVSKKEDIKLTEEDLLNCESIFNRIIKKEVKDYFEQVNVLKNDYIKLEESKSDILRSLHLKVLTWLGSIGLVIFEFIKEYKGEDLVKSICFSQSEKIHVILVMLIVAIIVIFMVFVIETLELLNEYDKIKKYYIENFYFVKKDFEKYVTRPSVDIKYIIVFILILIVLIIRLL